MKNTIHKEDKFQYQAQNVTTYNFKKLIKVTNLYFLKAKKMVHFLPSCQENTLIIKLDFGKFHCVQHYNRITES